jgi:Calcineurin-like phosphoesterase
MIQQVLSRKFVLDILGQVEQQLDVAPRTRRGARAAAPAIGEEVRREALRELRRARQREAAESSGQPGFDLPAASGRRTRRGARGAPPAEPIDETSFFSRSAVISNLQSAIEECLEVHQPELLEPVAPPKTTRRRGAPAPVVAGAEQRIRMPKIAPKSGRRLLGPFEPMDVGWVSVKFAEAIRWFRGKHDFPVRPNNDGSVPIGNRARVVLVGDWATGIPRALDVARRIRETLEEGKRQGLEQHVIHLGDVYYSGWPREYKKNFLDPWPVDLADTDRIGSWIISGNHDMYSGGKGLFETALADARFQRQGKFSYFRLENDYWNIFGLDTAYDDHALKDPQAEWLEAAANAAPGKDLMLLSHHQPFSAYEDQGPNLVKKLRPVLDGRGVTAWFWGHEHRCVLYGANMGVTYGRCIGHGGVPVYMNHEPDSAVPAPGEYEYRATISGDILHPWARFGFAILQFDGANIHVEYVDELNEHHRQETIVGGKKVASRKASQRS